MTQDEIINLADDAGFHRACISPEAALSLLIPLQRFAALVAAAEREACAKVAQAYEPRCDTCPSGVANAIRARGKA